MCRALKTPVTGGNVSFYNESNLGAVYPTPVIGMVVILEDVSKISYDNECMALWFFTDRNERSAKNDVEIYSARTGGRKVITRWANTILFFEHNDKQQIRLLKPDKNWSKIKRPVVQFKFSLNTYKELVKKLTK